jgi:hypothetical protein
MFRHRSGCACLDAAGAGAGKASRLALAAERRHNLFLIPVKRRISELQFTQLYNEHTSLQPAAFRLKCNALSQKGF